MTNTRSRTKNRKLFGLLSNRRLHDMKTNSPSEILDSFLMINYTKLYNKFFRLSN